MFEYSLYFEVACGWNSSFCEVCFPLLIIQMYNIQRIKINCFIHDSLLVCCCCSLNMVSFSPCSLSWGLERSEPAFRSIWLVTSLEVNTGFPHLLESNYVNCKFIISTEADLFTSIVNTSVQRVTVKKNSIASTFVSQQCYEREREGRESNTFNLHLKADLLNQHMNWMQLHIYNHTFPNYIMQLSKLFFKSKQNVWGDAPKNCPLIPAYYYCILYPAFLPV